jgi:hypothetical protein
MYVIEPSPVETYKRFMAEMFDESKLIKNTTLFQSLFGRPSTGAVTHYVEDSKYVEIDLVHGNERMASLVPRGTYSADIINVPDVVKERFSSIIADFPVIEEKSPFEAAQLYSRRAGETPYQKSTKLDRLRGLAADAHMKHVQRTIRRMEWLASASILAGVQPALEGTNHGMYNWNRDSDMFGDATVAWSETATADVFADLRNACWALRVKGQTHAEYAILGEVALENFLRNSAVLATADNRRIHQVEVNFDSDGPKDQQYLLDNGAVYHGKISVSGWKLALYSYPSGYTNSSNEFTKYIPDDLVLVGSTKTRADRFFGPDDRLPVLPSEAAYFQELLGFGAVQLPKKDKSGSGVISADMFHMDMVVDPGMKCLVLRTMAAPLFPTTHTNAWYVLNTAAVEEK